MLKITRQCDASSCSPEQVVDSVSLTYEQRVKGRLRALSDNGLELGLFLERGKVLRDGDLLQAEDGSVIKVSAAEELLCEGRTDDWLVFARCCYHLGNRHVPLEVGEQVLRFQPDHILAEMISMHGMSVKELKAPFNPEQGAYSGGQGHGHHHAH